MYEVYKQKLMEEIQNANFIISVQANKMIDIPSGPDSDVGTLGRLIIWHPFKPIFFKYLFIFDVLASLIAWHPGQCPVWSSL
jgi:hypothetical protein